MTEDSQHKTEQGIRKYPVPMRYIAGFVVLFVGVCVLGVAATLWYSTPAYTELLHGIDNDEAAVIAAELQNSNISFRFEQSTGAIFVFSDELQYARVKLAAKGLLYTNDAGRNHSYEFNAPKSKREANIQGFPNQILETELAKSIASFDYVHSARVHLAVANPVGEKNSQFSRASVVVRLFPGRRLTEAQISSISHLIASSVSNLSFENITIIDQKGELLKSAGETNSPNLTEEQFSYTRRVEKSYLDRIENILTPILGANAVRSQVAAKLEFNYPGSGDPQKGSNNKKHFEAGNILHLSATVVVDNRLVDNGDGQLAWVARSANEMKRITELVKHAIGYDAKRGDSVNIINEPFNLLLNNNMPQNPTIWQRFRVVDARWYIFVGLMIVFVGLYALRSKRTASKVVSKSAAGNSATESKDGNLSDKPQIVELIDEQASIDAVNEKTPFEQSMLKARQMVREEPKVVAQIVGSWVREGG